MVPLKKGFRHIGGHRISITNTNQIIARHIMQWDLITFDEDNEEVYGRINSKKLGYKVKSFNPMNDDSLALKCLKHWINGSGKFNIDYDNKHFSVNISKNGSSAHGKGKTLARAICMSLRKICDKRYSR